MNDEEKMEERKRGRAEERIKQKIRGEEEKKKRKKKNNQWKSVKSVDKCFFK